MAERTGDALPMLDAAARLRPEDAGYLADAGFAQLRAGNLHAARERLVLASELDGPPQKPRRVGNQKILRIEFAARPKAAANIAFDQPDR